MLRTDRTTPHNRPQSILNSAEVREYYGLLEIARRQVAGDRAITDKERTARAMVEAYFRGRLDHRRIHGQAVPA